MKDPVRDLLPIPQADPGAEYRVCQREIEAAIQRVLESGWYVLGREVAAFEKEFACYLGASHALGVASGTDALELALRACGIGPGDEVITVSHTAAGTITAIEHCGAKPVLVDIEPHRFTLAPSELQKACTPKTRAIVPVHLYGQPADMQAIGKFAHDRGLRVVEDCAQSAGAAFRNGPEEEWKKTGGLGDIAAFSFYPTKNLGAIGDGGAVVTNYGRIAESVRSLREYGWKDRYVSSVAGDNSRLDEIQAAILRVKLPHLDGWNEMRRRIAEIYDARFAGTVIRPPMRSEQGSHVFHQYVIQVPERDRVRERLASIGIGTAIHYPVPIHRQPAYQRLGDSTELPMTERVSASILSLPIYPTLGEERAIRVADEVLRAVG